MTKPKQIPTTIHDSHAFVLDQSRANVAFIKASPSNVAQAKQINAALANIVASERNVVMHKAIERAIQNDNDPDLQKLLKPGPSPQR